MQLEEIEKMRRIVALYDELSGLLQSVPVPIVKKPAPRKPVAKKKAEKTVAAKRKVPGDRLAVVLEYLKQHGAGATYEQCAEAAAAKGVTILRPLFGLARARMGFASVAARRPAPPAVKAEAPPAEPP